ncbi:MAG: hypothetical protein LBI16_00210 [Burkholderiales bacterium]|nr:hypothetical protein [Burkholderiales bacterium]
MTYVVPAAGTYRLEFGVVNWDDRNFDSGMAFGGVLIGGAPIGGTIATPVPENNALGIVAMVLLVADLGAARWSRSRC